MSLIDQMASLLSSVDETHLTIHPKRCISIRNRNVSCQRCVEACSSGALSITEEQAVCDTEKCIACGTCATACPTSAIEITSPDDRQLVDELKRSMVRTKGKPAVVCAKAAQAFADAAGEDRACADATNGDREARKHGISQVACCVPCLGRVDESLVLAAAAYGSSSLHFITGNCTSCDYQPGFEMCKTVASSAEKLLGAYGKRMDVSFTQRVPAYMETLALVHEDEPNQLVASPGAAPGADENAPAGLEEHGDADEGALPPYLEKVNAHGTLSHCEPTRRVRLYNYLKHLGKPVTDTISGRTIGTVTIDPQACCSCRMCTVFCPTGALVREDDDGSWGVRHFAYRCVQCRSCEQLCPRDALTVSAEVPEDLFADKKSVLWKMDQPNWQANRPDSMFCKVHQVIGDDLEMEMF